VIENAAPRLQVLHRLTPGPDCPRCPRLRSYRESLRLQQPGWHNAPVPSFGDPAARLLVVGLAPGVAGANRTGRPFTGDFAGDLLYDGLIRRRLALGVYERRPEDGLELVDCRITNAVRCVPPQNRPNGDEVSQCRPFLASELQAEPRPVVVLALGRIAWDSVLRALSLTVARHPFAHGAVVSLPAGPVLVGTYHSSRYNVNTGRLTPAMFERVLDRVRDLLDGASVPPAV
jgi:uracil-DNA glycosylase family 4